MENIPPAGITYITKSGYLMISKVFDDDIAWEVQRKLVNSYFRFKETISQDPTILAMQMITENIKLLQQEISAIKEQQNSNPIQKQSFSRLLEKYNLFLHTAVE